MSEVPVRTLRDVMREVHATSSTAYLEAAALACVDELRERGRSLGIEAERDQHATALRVIEALAVSARTVESIADAPAENEVAR